MRCNFFIEQGKALYNETYDFIAGWASERDGNDEDAIGSEMAETNSIFNCGDAEIVEIGNGKASNNEGKKFWDFILSVTFDGD